MRVCQMGIEVSMSSKTLMTQFANSLHVLVKSILRHLLHEFESHFMSHAIMKGYVVSVLLDHFTPIPGTLFKRIFIIR